MEIKTEAKISIFVGSSSPSKILSFDKRVRALELTREEALQLSAALVENTTTNVARDCGGLEVKQAPKIESDFISLLGHIEDEARQYMDEHCFPSHDFSHVLRVQRLCKVIGEAENADMLILYAAALLHDLGREAERKNPSVDHAEKSAEIARTLLEKVHFPRDKIPAVLYAIKVHRFSKGASPTTLEARILQDADRIDISGAIGIAMTFAYGGAYNRELYDINDPFAQSRELNDKNYTLDHFYAKLLNLPKTMHTRLGKQIAEKRTRFLQLFLQELRTEIESTDEY